MRQKLAEFRPNHLSAILWSYMALGFNAQHLFAAIENEARHRAVIGEPQLAQLLSQVKENIFRFASVPNAHGRAGTAPPDAPLPLNSHASQAPPTNGHAAAGGGCGGGSTCRHDRLRSTCEDCACSQQQGAYRMAVEANLKQLLEMGFLDEQENSSVLNTAANDIVRAIDELTRRP